MLPFHQLSFWEKKSYFENIDFLVIGAGIVGMSTALFLRKKYKNAKITVLERGYLPTGASSKNAGFTCFGSPTELFDDLKTMDEQLVWDTFSNRYHGLQLLFDLVGQKAIDYSACRSWDLIEIGVTNEISSDFITYINQKAQAITGMEQTYSEDKQAATKFGFHQIQTAYCNQLEGAIDTGKLIQALHHELVKVHIEVLYGMEAVSLTNHGDSVEVDSQYGAIKAAKAIIATNGFAQKWIDDDIKPARGQVIVTNEIKDLKVKGTFHFEQGYYYFRNVGNRILLGGGRNLNISGETTEEFGATDQIQDKLNDLLRTVILPDQSYSIDYSWSGIMGVGQTKKPIIKKIDEHTAIGVRMGGMGVAIGSRVGKELADLF